MSEDPRRRAASLSGGHSMKNMSVPQADTGRSLLLRASTSKSLAQVDGGDSIKSAVPARVIVPGSNRLNYLAKTNSFKIQTVSRAWMKELYQAWVEMGGDNPAGLMLLDLKKYLAKSRPSLLPFANSIYTTIDTERQGHLKFKRFVKAFYPEASARDMAILMSMASHEEEDPVTVETALLEEIHQAFTVYDDSGDGTLDEDEFSSALSTLNIYTEAEARDVFKLVDKDGSGGLSFQEFKEWFVNSLTEQQSLSRQNTSRSLPSALANTTTS